jgi:citrate synthase
MVEIDQRVQKNQYNDYLTAAEAAGLLGVKLPTLYAYTSRGLVRSVAGPKGRARRYLKTDLDRLRARRDARAGHGPVAAGALRFGEPVLDTSITAIDPERGPIYRGRVAVELAAADVRFEQVCELLWAGAIPEPSPRWIAHDFPLAVAPLARVLPSKAAPLEQLSIIVPLLASHDRGRFTTSVSALLPRARVLMRRMAAALVPGLDARGTQEVFEASDMAAALAVALGSAAGEPGVRAVGRALVLCADHELNASAFAARVAASTGADLYACISAALATLSGPRHGGAADRIEALIEEIGTPEQAERVAHDRARRGEPIEGFGHPLYPQGDPRGRALLELAAEIAPSSVEVAICHALIDAMQGSGGGLTVDLGLVALCQALDLPRGSAVGLFAMGRCAGWVAHVLEQYEAGYVLRPRARYLERD